jgi:hypothetical protein
LLLLLLRPLLMRMRLLLLFCGAWRIDFRFSIFGRFLGFEVGIFAWFSCFRGLVVCKEWSGRRNVFSEGRRLTPKDGNDAGGELLG